MSILANFAGHTTLLNQILKNEPMDYIDTKCLISNLFSAEFFQELDLQVCQKIPVERDPHYQHTLSAVQREFFCPAIKKERVMMFNDH